MSPAAARAGISRRRLLAFAGAASAAASTSARARAQGPLATLNVGTSPADAYAEPLYLAPSGLSARAGIAWNVSLFSSSAATAAGCASGSLDLGVADPVAIANGVIHGLPFRLLAPGSVYNGTSTSYLCVAKSARVTSAKDLNGTAIGTVTVVSSIALVAVKTWLLNNGADLNTIRFVEMPFAAMAAAIERGTISAASIAEPFLSQIPSDVRVLANPNEALGGAYATSLWFTTAAWLERNAALARRLVPLIYDVARWSNAHHAETAAALAAATHVDVDRVQKLPRAGFATQPAPQSIALSLNAAVKVGALSRPVSLEELTGA